MTNPRTCPHAVTVPVEVRDPLDAGAGPVVDVVAHLCAACGTELPANWGCASPAPARSTPMPTDLERFRDHAAVMARTDAHTDDCHSTTRMRRGGTITNRPDPACTGCVPAADRALWARLAAEVDAYLDRHDDAGLFDHPAPPPRYEPLPDPVIPSS